MVVQSEDFVKRWANRAMVFSKSSGRGSKKGKSLVDVSRKPASGLSGIVESSLSD